MATKSAKQVSHTPGPWRAVFPNRGVTEMSSVYAPTKQGDEPWRVAYVLREDHPEQRKVDDANARLIAAAPELLAACKFAADKINDPALVAVLDAAINKAEAQ